MNFTEEQLKKMKTAKTAEELIAIIKAEGIEASEDEIKAQFDAMHKEGELADDELENVSGAGCGGDDDSNVPSFNSGDRVRVTSGDLQGKTGTVKGIDYQCQDWSDYVWVLFDGESKNVSMPVDRLEHI